MPDGPKDKDGYSVSGSWGIRYRAHRVAYCKHNKVSIYAIADKVVRHTCDNRACVNPEHLVLGTPADNIRDQIERGRFRKTGRGETAPHVKLTEDQVREIRALRQSGVSVIALAKQFNLSRGYVYTILDKTTWSHI